MRRLLIILALLGLPCFAATKYLESGTDATQDLTFYSASASTGTGTIASATDQQHTGPRSLKANNGASQNNASATSLGGVVADAGSRISFWYRMSAVPATSTDQFFSMANSSGQNVAVLRIQTSGKININTGAGTDLSTGTTAVSINTWTRIAVSYTITSTTVFTIKVFLNGTLDSTAASSGTLIHTGSDRLIMGISNGNVSPANTSHWFDDIYVDDSSALTDPGNISITNKRPFANGTTNGYTTQIGSGGSGYGTGHAPQVNEQPLSVTNGWSMVGSGSAITEEYNIEGASVGDVGITGLTIVDYMGWLYSSSLLSETASMIVNGASTSISLTSTNTMFEIAKGSSTYPAGSGTDIGEITSTTVTTVSLYEAGVLIAFNPAAATFVANPQGPSVGLP